MIEDAIFSKLCAIGAITDLVGTRIYPNILPQGATLPAIFYSKVSRVRERAHGGPSNLDNSRIQFNVVADSYRGAKVVADALIESLDTNAVVGTWGSLAVFSVLIDNEYDLGYDEGSENYQIAVDAIIQHEV